MKNALLAALALVCVSATSAWAERDGASRPSVEIRSHAHVTDHPLDIRPRLLVEAMRHIGARRSAGMPRAWCRAFSEHCREPRGRAPRQSIEPCHRCAQAWSPRARSAPWRPRHHAPPRHDTGIAVGRMDRRPWRQSAWAGRLQPVQRAPGDRLRAGQLTSA